MRRLFISPLLGAALFAQAGGQPVNVPVHNQSFELGYGETTSEDLGVTPQQLQASPTHPGYFRDVVYTLTFSVENYDAPYPGEYTAEVFFGTQKLCNTSAYATRVLNVATLVCGGPAYIVADQALPDGGPVQGSSDLVFRFSVPGWTLRFQKVSFSFIPVD